MLQEYAKKTNAQVFLPDFMDGELTPLPKIAGSDQTKASS